MAATMTTPLIYAALLWWPLNPIELKSVSIINADKMVFIGDEIFFQVHYVKNTDKNGIVYRQLIDGRVVNIAPHVSNVPKGEATRIGFIKTGPGDLPGRYRINYSVAYEYFGFRNVVVSAMSDEFNLVERKENGE